MVTAARQFAAQVVYHPSFRSILTLALILGLIVVPNAPISGGGGVV